MIQQRLIEKVIVPSNKKKSVNASVKCFRLVEDEPPSLSDDGLAVFELADDVEDFPTGTSPSHPLGAFFSCLYHCRIQVHKAA